MCTKNDCWRAKSNQRGGYPFRDVCKTAVYLLEMRPASSVTFENNVDVCRSGAGKRGRQRRAVIETRKMPRRQVKGKKKNRLD